MHIFCHRHLSLSEQLKNVISIRKLLNIVCILISSKGVYDVIEIKYYPSFENKKDFIGYRMVSSPFLNLIKRICVYFLAHLIL